VVVASLRAPATALRGLAAVAMTRPVVEAELVVSDDPQAARPRNRTTHFRTPLLLVPGSMRTVRSGKRMLRMRVPVLVVAHGPAWQRLLPSQRVVVWGRLLPARPGDAVAFVLAARGPPEHIGAPARVQRIAGRVRAGLRAAAAALPRDERGLLPGLVDGDVSELPAEVRADFRTTGLTHLVAVSGANVAIVAAAAFGLARVLGLGLRGRAVLAGAAIVAFVVLARPSPSVLRAAVMGGLALAALATGRLRAGVPALAAAVLVLVLIEPGLATSDGFVLSVLATGGLLLVAPRLCIRLRRRLPQWLAESLAVAVAAQLMTTPYIAWRFARVSLLSVPANLLAALAVPFATIAGVVSAVLASICLPLARVAAWVGFLPTAWLVAVARLGADVPGAAVSWPRGVPGLALLIGGGLAGLLLVRVRRRRMERWADARTDRAGAADADRR
jgi:competence protein ComEC